MNVRRSCYRLLSLCAVMMLSVAFAAFVGAANGAPSVTSRSGGAHWGLLIAIAVGVAAFVVSGLFIIVRSRREYLDIEARKASRPPEEEE